MEGEKTLYLFFPYDLTVEVRGDFEIDPEEIAVLAQTYLPGVKIGHAGTKPTLAVEYIQSIERQLIQSGDKIQIFDDWNGKLSLDIWNLLYSIIRLHYMRYLNYPVHAACLGRNKHMLLVGHSGVGKSTILLGLIDHYDWTVYSGNKTVVTFEEDGLWAIAGTKSMSLRSVDITRFPNLTGRKIDYQTRSAFALGKNHYSKDEAVPISTIFIAKLNDGVSEMEELSFPSTLHTLYPFFMDAVNADTVMCEGGGVFIGTPPKGSQEKLTRELTRVLSQIKVVKISGTLQFVTESIAKES